MAQPTLPAAAAAQAVASNPNLNPNAVFPPHDPSAAFSFPRSEEEVLAFWKDIDAFQESLRQSEGKPLYTFYDGPPFATGLPHHGHILMGTVKDIVTRFAHSSGFHVERRFGWDTHGLPVEHEIDKKLNIKSKEDVLAMGIDKYNAECRAIVMRYSSEWRRTVERLGRWIDFDNDYKTLNTSFMESVWWVFGQLWKKDLVYRGVRVMPYTTGCTTPLSNFEAQQAYKDVQDPAVTVAFKLLDRPAVSVLAWTTTPWTLPTNLALCVHPDLSYVEIHDVERDANFILCDQLLAPLLFKDAAKALKDKKYTVVNTYKGSEMVGWKYEPLFDYFKEQYGDRAFKVVADTYVTATSGTGIVHQAPAFGEDDHRIAIREGIVGKEDMPPCPLDEQGRYTDEVTDFKGLYIKEADKLIMKKLKEEGRLIVQSTITHSYPFCWRSGTPLIYRCIPVWFVRVQDSTDKLVKNNEATRWVPQSVGDARFKNWLENARDWNISRNRYWGTPLPLWASEDYEEIVCVSSVEELNELAGCGILEDLHRDKIDHITIPSKKGKGVLRRVEEVFDCWFESGSMPYAQVHYPFENKEKFERSFPADFISEAMDQTRGWFYTLLVLSSHLFDTAPWKNLIVCGHVLAEDGKKMSKSLKNFPDPNLIVDTYGADALRLFLVNSPVVRGDSLRFREAGVKEVISSTLLPFLNSFRFFLGHAALYKKEFEIDFRYDPHAPVSGNVMDRWILARCQSLVKLVKEEMEAYRLYTVAPKMLTLLDELTNWYIRFNRRRLKGEDGKADTTAALQTLFETLFTLCRALSAFIPFITETIYQGLRQFFPIDTKSLGLGDDVRSLHFLPFPSVREEYYDTDIERQVARMQAVIELGRQARKAPVPEKPKEKVVEKPKTKEEKLKEKAEKAKEKAQKLLEKAKDKADGKAEEKTEKVEVQGIAVKLPLAELVVSYNEPEPKPDVEPVPSFKADVEPLVTYIQQELNVRTVTFSTDEAKYGVHWTANADFAVLGRKIKAKLPEVKAGLQNLSPEQVRSFLDTKTIVVAGVTLTKEDIALSRVGSALPRDESDPQAPLFVSQSDGEVVVLLDVLKRDELVREGIARDVVSRVQKLRKEAGLVATDDIGVFYACNSEVAQVFEAEQELIRRVLRCVPKPASEMGTAADVIIKREEDLGEHKVVITLVR